MSINTLLTIGNEESLGDIIVYETTGMKVPTEKVRESLVNAGLSAEFAKQLRNKTAFTRAAKQFQNKRLLRIIPDSDKKARKIRFQLTEETQSGQELLYCRDCTLTMDKDTGYIAGDKEEDVEKARSLFAITKVTYTGTDLSSIIHKIFDSHRAFVFLLKPTGDIYFVPSNHASLTQQVKKFCDGIGVQFTTYVVPKASSGAPKTKEVVAAGMKAKLQELREAIGELNSDCHNSTLEKTVERVRAARFKVDAYADFLESSKEEIAREADEIVRQALEAKDRITEEKEEIKKKAKEEAKEKAKEEPKEEPKENTTNDTRTSPLPSPQNLPPESLDEDPSIPPCDPLPSPERSHEPELLASGVI